MRSALRRRYWCDYCNKGGMSAYHIRNHELHCVYNSNRICRMCERLKDGLDTDHFHDLRSMIEALGDGDVAGVERLRLVSGGCPACMLSAVVWLQKASKLSDPRGEPLYVPFDFKRERDELWATVNAAEEQWP